MTYITSFIKVFHYVLKLTTHTYTPLILLLLLAVSGTVNEANKKVKVSLHLTMRPLTIQTSQMGLQELITLATFILLALYPRGDASRQEAGWRPKPVWTWK